MDQQQLLWSLPGSPMLLLSIRTTELADRVHSAHRRVSPRHPLIQPTLYTHLYHVTNQEIKNLGLNAVKLPEVPAYLPANSDLQTAAGKPRVLKNI